MKFSAPADALRAALARVTGIIEARQVVPVLGCVRIVASGRVLRVSATDLEIWVDALVEGAAVEDDGEAVIPAAELSKLVTLAKKSHVEIDVAERVATLRYGRTSAELLTLPVEDFPRAPSWSEYAMQDVDGALLARALRFCGVTMSDEETKFFLRGVHLMARDGGTIADGTDGHTLHRMTLPAMPVAGHAIIPGKHVPVAAAIADAGGRVLLGLGETWWAVEGGGVRARGSIIDGTFPDVDRIIATDPELVAIVDRDALREAIDAAATGALKTASKAVHVVLDIAGDEIAVRGFKPGSALARGVSTSIDAETRAPLRATFNASYLQDTLRALDCDRVAIFSPDPLIIHVEPAQQPVKARAKAVIMGIRASAEEMAA